MTLDIDWEHDTIFSEVLSEEIIKDMKLISLDLYCHSKLDQYQSDVLNGLLKSIKISIC